ncbi:MAG: hypothetical protein K2W95_17835 [Candidatus Obscuribacterales bacterium]|nr:hypothetical protein [Candidatus Obscuribacterales bacterium]
MNETPASSESSSPASVPPSWLKLLLISFATLFFEILVIRWVASEIRMFGYMKNLTLMACVLGMGIGCSAISKDSTRFKNSTIGFTVLFSILSTILAFAPKIGLTDMTFVLGTEVYNWQFTVNSVTALFTNIICLASVFLLVVAIFDFLGQELGKQISAFPPLKGYGINLAGSLAGVLAFSLMSFLGASPTIWCIIGLASIAIFCATKKQSAIFSVLSLCVVALAQFSVAGSTWTPYYRIDLRPLHFWYNNGAKIDVPYELGTIIEVNHTMHQAPFNFSKEFFKLHPELYDSNDYFTYNLPYEAQPKLENALILGAGSGNDVAVCLQHQPQTIDAVEIDPGILQLGRRIHPMKPYDDLRVQPHINDARAYLASDKKKYDVIVFAYLDSQTALSTLSSLRLDNYLYTTEALESATKHLKDNGIASLSFSAQPIWLQARLYQMAKSVYGGKEPLLLRTGFHGNGSLAILWGPGLEAVRGDLSAKYKDKVISPTEYATPVELPTDDWPFLYQKERNLPMVYIAMLTSVLLMSSWLVFSRFRLKTAELAGNLQFFFLGAGFLLLETRGMLAVAALFGSTWIVNSIVIGILLSMALLSNWLVNRYQNKLSETPGYVGLLITLAVNYLIPLSSFAGEAFAMRALVAFALIGSPFLFTGIIFSGAFARAEKPQVALGMNILGAILGGCLEYFSTVVGTTSLTLIAAAIYAVSMLVRKRQA